VPSGLAILLGCLAVLALDGGGARASQRFGFRYALLAPASLLLYVLTGFFAARLGDFVLFGTLGGACAAAVDATFGWRLARALGIEHAHRDTLHEEARVAAKVTLGGALVGTLAGLFA
jgi:hypothetical protein